ncbi:hypothetical protein AURDEDRAFT_140569 [Auricularia subglabra TFB-10046 SS5]|uniref:DUF6570 domain-containing protein n=1 Tax=Auricularia subglabra (strain TFB-10046 / SS5) TaxID=717982 RepID=J0WR46_AURST|nr:hypothetical protein AURDEDRAFT_140569 [Auricularia subglabra TFB-10046 SS5]
MEQLLDEFALFSDDELCAAFMSLDICSDCDVGLRSSRVPRVSLRNGLYRGILPDEFKDLSWVEEQICAINVAACKIVRLHGSSNPENPFVLYGNTCAHPMNVVETAKVLPRAPTDIAGRLGVIFVGPKKYKPKALGDIFRVRRHKVIAFLRWLCAHNKLYSDLSVDFAIFDQYPEDGPLPGLDSRIVHREWTCTCRT